jgi:hypothetical protein
MEVGHGQQIPQGDGREEPRAAIAHGSGTGCLLPITLDKLELERVLADKILSALLGRVTVE